jgi:hypothetical protein
MAYALRSYSGEAQATSLLNAIGTADTSFTVASAATWLELPGYTNTLGTSGPFVVAVDFGTSNEEKMLCSSVNSTSGVVSITTRGYDGSTAQSHAAGAVVVPVFSAQEAYEANRAVYQTLGQIAAAGDLLVGTGANALDNLTVGADGSLLKVNASGNVAWTGAGSAGNILTSTGSDVAWASAVPPYLLVSKATGNPSITGSLAAVPFNNTIASAGASGTIPTLDTTTHNGRVTIKQAGLYRVEYCIGAQYTSPAVEVFTEIVKNPGGSSSSYLGSSAMTNVAIFGAYSNGAITLPFALNDTLEVQVSASGPGSSVLSSGSPYPTWLSVTYVGPAS